MDNITINIVIVDRPYKLTVSRSDEEKVRRAAALINEKVKSFSKHYTFKDQQDLLAMTALQFATSTVKYETDLAFNGQHLEQKLKELDNLLDESAQS